ncbi:MAG: carboxypeptidase-like regulatory domain-containing protein, partial [Spirochaetia bacterium]|nr:carboxypeptidase-like regulatory domain-containing protein [Spirochaetia bacterium]
MKKIIFTAAAMLFMTATVLAAPRLLIYPKTLLVNSDNVTVTWDDGAGNPYLNTSRIVYGTMPGNYTHSVEQTAAGTASFVPSAQGGNMNGGVYYCRVSDTVDSSTSQEFRLYINSGNAPVYSSPANGAALNNLSPSLEWQPLQGVPFYTVLVFDTKAVIDISSGSINVQANVIWGATTDRTSIIYGTPDASGYFDKMTPPPLMQGLTYSWIVLPNYDGSPGMIAANFAGTRTFTVTPPSSAAAPVLVAPMTNVTMTAASLPINLSWDPASGANSYRVFLMRSWIGSSLGGFGDITVPLWSGETNQTNINIPQNLALNGTWYEWYVIAVDNTGRGIKSEVRKFYYDSTDRNINVTIREPVNPFVAPSGNTIVPYTVAFIQSSTGGNVNLYPMVGGSDGTLSYYLPVNEDYKFTLKKTGFVNVTYAVTAGVSDYTADWYMTRCSYAMSGRVQDNLGNDVQGATVRATQAGEVYETLTLSDGTFMVYIPANGAWSIEADKAGHSPATVTYSVASGPLEVNVSAIGTIIINKNVNSLTGKITNSDGQPVNGAAVTVYENGNPSNLYPASTDVSGNYSLTLPDGTWIINVNAAGFVPPPLSSVTFSTSPGDEARVRDFTMTPQACAITGNVADLAANALAGATVSAINNSTHAVIETVTDALGHYTLNVGTGGYMVNASLSGYTSDGARTVTFTAGGQNSTADFTMTANALVVNDAALYVFVHITAGTAVGGADVIVSGNDANTSGFTASGITDSSGRITFTAMVAGGYDIAVSKAGYTSYNGTAISVSPGPGNASVTINPVVTTGTLGGNITSSTPASGVTVQVFLQSNPDTAVTSDIVTSPGSYSFNLSPGDYMVKIFKDGYSASPAQAYKTVVASTTVTQNFDLTAASGGGVVVSDPSFIVYNENIGGPYQFTASFTDGSGKNVYCTIAWSCVPSSAGTMSESGVFTPASDYIGEVSIVATALGTSQSVTIPVYQRLNPSYGAVTVTDYAGFSLAIPAGAASASNTTDRITMTKAEVSRARSVTRLKKAMGMAYMLTGFTFNSDVTITLPLLAGYETASAKVGRWDTDSNTWADMGGTVSG